MCVVSTEHHIANISALLNIFLEFKLFFNVRHVQPPHTYLLVYLYVNNTNTVYIQTVCAACFCMEEDAKLRLLMRDDVRWCARSSLNPRIKMNRFAVQWICYMHKDDSLYIFMKKRSHPADSDV